MEYAVDMQGFLKPGNDFVLKEIAICPLNIDEDPAVILFKPPFPWKKFNTKYRRKNLHLEMCVHGLEWDSGDYDYTEIGKILRDALKDAAKIFVISEARREWLERFNFKVSVLSDWGFPFIERPKIVTVCTNHNGAYKALCAMHNVKLMKHFYRNSPDMEWEDIE